MMLEMELSQELFPLTLVDQVLSNWHGTGNLQMAGVDGHTVLMRIQGNTPEQTRAHYNALNESLSDAVLDYLAHETMNSEPLPNPGCTVDVTCHFVHDGVNASLSMSCPTMTHSPQAFLRALVPLRQGARIRVDSTNPIDRIMVTIRGADLGSLAMIPPRLLRSINAKHIW